MGVQWRTVISGLIAGYRSTMLAFAVLYAFLVGTFVCRSFAKIVAEFLTEVGVLVLVFPTLDTIIQKGDSKVTTPLIIGSIVLAIFCLVMAGIISTAGEPPT